MIRTIDKRLLDWKNNPLLLQGTRQVGKAYIINQFGRNEYEIYPLEVKSGLNRNKKSLKSYESKFNPKLIYRLSPRNYIQSDNFINIPLYSAEFFK